MTEIKFSSECHGPIVNSGNSNLEIKDFGVKGVVEDTVTSTQIVRKVWCPALGTSKYKGRCVALSDAAIHTQADKKGFHTYPIDRYPIKCRHVTKKMRQIL